jgi:uncharacterized protein YdaU (DUF1376 family)
MPLYVADYLADTGHLSTLEHGAYLLLIMHYWRVGCLPADDRKLANICRVSVHQWKAIRPTIAAFFRDDWTHKRIDFLLASYKTKADARADSGSKGGKAKAMKNKESLLAKATILPEQTPSKPLPSSSDVRSQLATTVANKPPTAAEIETKAREFYDLYPKKINPADASKTFARAVKSGVSPDTIIDAARRFAEAHRLAGTEKHFIPAPAVWLNRGGYDSEDLPTPPARASPGAVAKKSPASHASQGTFIKTVQGIANGTYKPTDDDFFGRNGSPAGSDGPIIEGDLVAGGGGR